MQRAPNAGPPPMQQGSTSTPPVRLAELLAALSLALDLGLGQPMEHLLRSCLLAMRFGQALGLPHHEMVDVYWLAFLRFLGCTAASEITAAILGDDVDANSWIISVDQGRVLEVLAALVRNAGRSRPLPQRARILGGALVGLPAQVNAIQTAHCEAAQHLAGRFGFRPSILAALGQIYERWDGKGLPNGLKEAATSRPMRVVQLAQDADLFHQLGGPGATQAIVHRRSGGAYEPRIAEVFAREADSLLAGLDTPSIWDAVLEVEPRPWQTLSSEEVDRVCTAIADLADLKSPYFVGHSEAVADLAAATARAAGLPEDDTRAIWRAGLVHDLGRLAVSTGIWEKPGPLTNREWERVRLHPYYTERVLSQSDALGPLGRIAACGHERADGSGYPHGTRTSQTPVLGRILAAADVYQALTERRPHRPAHSPEAAADELRQAAAGGRLDREAVDWVLTAAGYRKPRARQALPLGLTEREVEVVELLAHGYRNRQIAGKLVISAATVDHHLRHIYQKLGVSTRAGATLVALQNHLVGDFSAA